MEETKRNEIEEVKRNGSIVLCGTLVVGYILGRLSVNQAAVESYRRGVSDTLKFYSF